VTGEVLLRFALLDLSNPSAAPEETMKKFMAIASTSPTVEGDEDDEALERVDSGDLDDKEDDELETSDDIEESEKPEAAEKRKKRLRLAKIKKKATLRAYEFSDKSEVAGVLFLEVVKILDLPPEKNSGKPVSAILEKTR
jgi:phosphatidylserine decarboxylase